MTRTTPVRRMILHFSQIFFTDALTFIVYLLFLLHEISRSRSVIAALLDSHFPAAVLSNLSVIRTEL